MLRKINRLFVMLTMLFAFSSILLSILILFIPDILGEGLELENLKEMGQLSDFVLEKDGHMAKPDDSPFLFNYSIKTPTLKELDMLYLEIYSEGRYISEINCLEGFESFSDYENLTEFECTAYFPYDYTPTKEYLVYATLYGDGYEYVSGPSHFQADWSGYEGLFWEVAIFMAALVAGTYLFIVFPVTVAIAFLASKMKHEDARPGEYTILSLLNPLKNGKTILQRFNSFLVSPYFWMLEAFGILIILSYLILSAQAWKSLEALVAFFLSGVMAFIIPFLWCAAFWYADFREREPLRILITFFLWGMFAALMAIGINSVAGVLLSVLGIGFLGAFLIAPPIEEFFKGSGLALVAEHHEYNSIEDGFVFGFVIGMGFSFVENWVYMLSYPMGSDILGWFLLFLLRSIAFSSIHGLFTAITGGLIGYLKERKYPAPALGLIPGFLIAALFHAVHNSGELLATLLGAKGVLAYFCILIPLFDYGGTVLLFALFIWALFRKKN